MFSVRLIVFHIYGLFFIKKYFHLSWKYNLIFNLISRSDGKNVQKFDGRSAVEDLHSSARVWTPFELWTQRPKSNSPISSFQTAARSSHPSFSRSVEWKSHLNGWPITVRFQGFDWSNLASRVRRCTHPFRPSIYPERITFSWKPIHLLRKIEVSLQFRIRDGLPEGTSASESR